MPTRLLSVLAAAVSAAALAAAPASAASPVRLLLAPPGAVSDPSSLLALGAWCLIGLLLVRHLAGRTALASRRFEGGPRAGTIPR